MLPIDQRDSKFMTHAEELIQQTSAYWTPATVIREIKSTSQYFYNKLSSGTGTNKSFPGRSVSNKNCVARIPPGGLPLKGIFHLIPSNFEYSKPYKNVISSRFCPTKLVEQRSKIR